MRVDKGPRTVASNKKSASGKLLLTTTTLVKNELLPNFLKVKSLEDSSNQDDNDIRLLSLRAGKGPRTTVLNRKPANGKLLLTSNKLALEIGQNVRVKKVLTLKIGY